MIEDKILILDDVIDEAILEGFVEMLPFMKDSLPRNDEWANYSNRWFPPSNTPIPNTISKLLRSKKILEPARKKGDLSWKWFVLDITHPFEVQITDYAKDTDHYEWHVDHFFEAHNDKPATNRLLNYIFYLIEPQTGGELELANDETLKHVPGHGYEFFDTVKIKPKKNRMVLMSSWIPHRVLPSKGRRVTINGHVGI